MGENTKIEWAHHTSSRQRVFFSTTLRFGNWLQMNFLMAVLAKRNAVAKFVAKLWEISKSFYVMCIQVAALAVAAMLAGVRVSAKNGGAPVGVFNCSTLAQIALVLAVFIGVVVLASCATLSRDLTQSRFRFGSVRLAGAIRSPQFCRCAHLKLGFYCVRSSFESGWPPPLFEP